jgi:hypothetical protein
MNGPHKQAEYMNAPAETDHDQNTCVRGAVYT